ncbi:MAG: hypothetical protein GEU90_22080 [Gemmatimonas sp.]|nr:hypothetical protein [Gemmatimonas sp.]
MATLIVDADDDLLRTLDDWRSQSASTCHRCKLVLKQALGSGERAIDIGVINRLAMKQAPQADLQVG